MKITLPILLLLCLTGMDFRVSAQSSGDISVKIDPRSGRYTVTSALLHRTFEGNIGQPAHDLRTATGKDAIGVYNEVSFTWKSGVDYAGRIRWYARQPVVVFSLSLPGGSEQPPVAFPRFMAVPGLPYRFSYHNHIFALPQFSLEQTSTPWLLYDDSADACIISPASDFIVSLMSAGTRLSAGDSAAIVSGLNPEVKELPAHFTHSTIMVMDNGIRKTWDEWGDALRALYKRKRPANDCDALLKYFGYWTDNGADYYYNYDTAKGYSATLQAVRQHYQEEGIRLGYMQLDSWWYEKSNYNMDRKRGAPRKNPQLPAGPWNLSGGLMEYKADPFLFPDGLAAFQQKLELPLVTHNRWIDPNSPYNREYRISGFAAVDTAFWKHIMDYLKSAGVTGYEQDWMNYIYQRDPGMISDVRTGNAFTDGMAHAAMRDGIDLQYCMAMPRYFMQGLKYNNLTTIRPSGDRFTPERWMNFIFTSQLAYEMGIWPWCDVFKSPETGNMIVSVLSAGPVGTGDAIGKEDKANILRACRNDGVLVKPDAPLLPMDEDYVQIARGQSKPVLAYTATRHGHIITGYVFAFADDTTADRQFSFRPMNMGMRGNVVVYNPQQNTPQLIGNGETFYGELPGDKYAYYIVAPVTASGIAFLGDAGKITATGKERIAGIGASGNALEVNVLFAGGESAVTLRGYSERPVTTDKGRISLDAATHLFTLSLPAPAAGNSESVHLKTIAHVK